jgi:hypothetical protein
MGWDVAEPARPQAASSLLKVADPNAIALILRKSRRLNFAIEHSVFPNQP